MASSDCSWLVRGHFVSAPDHFQTHFWTLNARMCYVLWSLFFQPSLQDCVGCLWSFSLQPQTIPRSACGPMFCFFISLDLHVCNAFANAAEIDSGSHRGVAGGLEAIVGASATRTLLRRKGLSSHTSQPSCRQRRATDVRASFIGFAETSAESVSNTQFGVLGGRRLWSMASSERRCRHLQEYDQIHSRFSENWSVSRRPQMVSRTHSTRRRLRQEGNRGRQASERASSSA